MKRLWLLDAKLNMLHEILLLYRYNFFLLTSLSFARAAQRLRCTLTSLVCVRAHLVLTSTSCTFCLSLSAVTTSSANSPPATKIWAEVRASWTSTRWMQIEMRVNTVIALARLWWMFLSEPFLRARSPLQCNSELLIWIRFDERRIVWGERGTWITEFTEKSCEPLIYWRDTLPEAVQKEDNFNLIFRIGWTRFEI